MMSEKRVFGSGTVRAENAWNLGEKNGGVIPTR